MTFYINNPDDDGLYSKQKYHCKTTEYRGSAPTIEQRLANMPGHGIFIDEGYPDEAFDTLFYFTTSREMNDGIEVTRSDNITYTGSTYNIQSANKTVTETYITSTVNTSAWYNTTETRKVTFSADIEKRVGTTTLSYRVVSGVSGGYSLRSGSVSFHKYSVTTTARYQYLSDSSLVYGNLNIELSTNSVVNANTFSYTRSATNGAQTKTTGTFIINQGSAASTFTGSSFTYNASFYQVVLNVLRSSTTWENPENKDKYTFTAGTVVSGAAVESLTNLIWPSPKTNNLATFYSHRFRVTGSNDVMKSAINYSAGFGYPDDASYVKYDDNYIWGDDGRRVESYTSKYYSTFSNTDNKTVSVTKTRTRTVTDYINGATLSTKTMLANKFYLASTRVTKSTPTVVSNGTGRFIQSSNRLYVTGNDMQVFINGVYTTSTTLASNGATFDLKVTSANNSYQIANASETKYLTRVSETVNTVSGGHDKTCTFTYQITTL